ncbi:MAG: ATP-binding cassette domain-containing protein [Actinomycetota bacterium]|nr:ATP-binding cassette domain-containing protein [Actinomycetota bacterium]
MGNIIEVKNLTKNYGNLTAVDNISFSVRKGEIFGFLGPNGAGKTTTIRLLTGILIPDSGEVLIDGININNNPIKAKMKLGVIPETSNIYVDLTARQNIILAGRYFGFSGKELYKKSDSLLDIFELYDRKDEPVRTFSKGMKQRVNIASAIVHEPEILFLDELTSGLDVNSQRLIKNIIKDIHQKGTTIFLTTHNIEEANQLCNEVAIISSGKIAVIDRPEVLRNTFEQTRAVEISFNITVASEEIRQNNLIDRIEMVGDRLKLNTGDPDKLVKYLVNFSEEKKLKIISLEILKPSLEDAFIKFTEKKVMKIRNVNSQYIRGIIITAEKNIRIYYAKPPVLIFGIIFPLFLFLSFYLGRKIDLNVFFPGFLAMSLFFAASSVGPLITPWEKQAGTYEKLLSFPVTVNTIILGDVIAGMLYGIIINIVVLTFGLIFLANNVNVWGLIFGTLLASFCFSSLACYCFACCKITF